MIYAASYTAELKTFFYSQRIRPHKNKQHFSCLWVNKYSSMAKERRKQAPARLGHHIVTNKHPFSVITRSGATWRSSDVSDHLGGLPRLFGARNDARFGDRKKENAPQLSLWGLCSHYLSSRAVTRQVLSAQMSLTSVFGMGTGGPSSQSIRTYVDGF